MEARFFTAGAASIGSGEAGECIDPCLRRHNPSLNLSVKISVCGENLFKNLGGITNLGYMLKSRSNISVVISVKDMRRGDVTNAVIQATVDKSFDNVWDCTVGVESHGVRERYA